MLLRSYCGKNFTSVKLDESVFFDVIQRKDFHIKETAGERTFKEILKEIDARHFNHKMTL